MGEEVLTQTYGQAFMEHLELVAEALEQGTPLQGITNAAVLKDVRHLRFQARLESITKRTRLPLGYQEDEYDY